MHVIVEAVVWIVAAALFIALYFKIRNDKSDD
jgi:hypothetical protein